MRKLLVNLLLSIGFFTPCLAHAQPPEKPIWAKQATPLDLSCTTHPSKIASPDHRSSVEVTCTKKEGEDPLYAIRIVTSDGTSYNAPLDEGSHEILWSPDSKAFFIDGGTTAFSGFFLTVYIIDPSRGIQKTVLTQTAQQDMVISFPPCKASNRDAAACGRIAANPEYNMSGIAWVHNSSAIDVFAEVPCSSSYGGIMCQVLGYELSVPDGEILKRLTAKQVKLRWQKWAAWNVRVPDSPQYGPEQTIR